MQYCQKCLNVSTRPRITFNSEGVCGACQWSEKKKKINWDEKRKGLLRLCDKFRKRDTWDVIVPFSGGKDSVYVAWKMKELGMHPLLVTLVPHLETYVGKRNRERMSRDFDCLTITPKYETYRELSIIGFKEQGRPKLPFVTGISTAVVQIALKMDIPFIMYGEEGEAEYGGASGAKTKIDRQYLVDYYYSGHDPSKYGSWWALPPQEELDKLFPTHYSKFENWDSKVHADFAISKGMEIGNIQIGTFTNYAQLSDSLQDLHAYLQFLKFGFGRCTSDANIEIRAGRITRQEGTNLVRAYDGQVPYQYLQDYLDYFRMTKEEFWNTIDSFANLQILRPRSKNGLWELKDKNYV